MSEWTEVIAGLRLQYPLKLLSKLRKMACSVFYYYLKCLKSSGKHATKKEMVKSIFHEYKGHYGY